MDWTELNPDLLHLNVKKLGDISNFIRFRDVCKQWHMAGPTSDAPPRLPWFLECSPVSEDKCCYRFYSLYSNKTQNLHIPQAQDTYIYHGSSCQYVQCIDNLEIPTSNSFAGLKLLDPLTGSKIPMPFIGSKVPLPLKDESINLQRLYIGPNHCYSPSSNLDGTERELAMLEGYGPRGHTYLIALLLLDGGNGTTSLAKHILHQKIVFCEADTTKLLDVTTRDVVTIEQRLGLNCLLEACGDVLGLVLRFRIYEHNKPWDEIFFDVYRLEDVATTPRWVKMNDGIGDRMLFLQPSFRTGFCLNARHFHGFKGNCIYFQNTLDSDGRSFLCRFDIEEGTAQLLPVGFHGLWFVPHL